MTEGTGWESLSLSAPPIPRVRLSVSERAKRRLRGLVTATGCALLVACGEPSIVPPQDASRPPGANTPVVSPALEPGASPVPSLGEIVWAASSDPVTNEPQGTVSTFAPEAPRISAFALTTALPAGSTIDATWEYNDTSLDAFASQIVVPTPTDQTWISFHIDRSETELWPVGSYEITISLDGREAQRAAVNVANPE